MIVHEVEIARIAVLGRRREDLGDIDGLAGSIQSHGLLHPITLNRDNVLVCGERRLAAFVQLERQTIPAVFREDLTGDTLREVELEENLRRKDLTSYEQSRTLADLAELARKEAKAEAEALRGKFPRNSPGRPSEAGSLRDVAARVGYDKKEIQDAEAHVATAEAFPRFKQPQWNQANVLTARKALSRLPEEERERAVAFVDAPYIPPKDAVEMIESLAAMPEEMRASVFSLGESPDRRDRDLAITTAAKKTHCPDPRVVVLRGFIRDLKPCLKSFPDDPLNPQIEALIVTITALAEAVDQQHKERIHNALRQDH